MLSENRIKPDLSETALPKAWPPIETDIGKVAEYEHKLEEMLKQLGWEEFDALDVSLVFHEWLINAMLHGNMGITRGKEETDEKWEERIIQAQSLSEVRAKRVLVEIKATAQRLEVSIQDEGKDSPEFWLDDGVPIAMSEEKLKYFSGRGYIVTRAFVNNIHFEKNDKGVKVIFIRDLEVPLPERKSE